MDNQSEIDFFLHLERQMWRTHNFMIDVLPLLSAAKSNGRMFQQSSIALLYAIVPQNCAEHKKKLVFVFDSCAHTGVRTAQARGAARKEVALDKRIMDSNYPCLPPPSPKK
jgi:hypothetical protein